MAGEFVFARNAEPDSRLPFLLRRTTRKTRPRTRQATGTAGGEPLGIVVDAYERYPYRFAGKAGRGHVELRRGALPAGDYGIEVDGGLAEAQVRWPSVPIVFCETRPLAEEWTYRFLAAARAELQGRAETDGKGRTCWHPR